MLDRVIVIREIRDTDYRKSVNSLGNLKNGGRIEAVCNNDTAVDFNI